MANPRLILWMAFVAVLYLNFATWMKDYGGGSAPAAASAARQAPTGVVQPPGKLSDEVPSIKAPSGVPASATAAAASAAVSAAGVATPSDPKVRVTTDVLDVDISLRGGDLIRTELKKYPVHKDAPNIPVHLFDNSSDSQLYVLQSGLTSSDGGATPDHHAFFSAPAGTFALAPGATELRVPLTYTDAAGLTVVKTFVFRRGAYAVDLDYDVQNHGTVPRQLASYAQLLRHWEPAKRSYFNVESYSFKGPALWDGAKYRRLNVAKDDDKAYKAEVTNGWIASLEHHFVAAVVPQPGLLYHFDLSAQDQEYRLRATGPAAVVAAPGAVQFHEKLFFGPKLQDQLAATGPELDRAADYGQLTIIARPLFIALKWVHRIVGNWGWSIVIVTALIKLLFYPLSQASGRSMAKMRAVAPRMKQIQEQYKDDREKLGRAMMELYKREKVNPLAGCLPMVVQIPVFISFYWVLLESVEMRQAPFMLWVNDLSSRDPIFVLPLLMGAAMFGQFKLNPPPPDPTQAKVMQFMPLVMTAMMAWFPSGLVLYWLTNTVLSIAQQYRINQVVEAEAKKARS
jgi:YidC/Oxa1 family membrane protein insertase